MKPFPLLTSLLLFSAMPMQGTVVAKGDFFAVTAVKPMMELPGDECPVTLREALALLEKHLPKKELTRIDAMKSADEMAAYHRELGPLIRMRWGLWKERAERNVAHDLREKGILRAPDMSAAILHALWGWQHGRNPPSEIALWVENHPEVTRRVREKPPVKPVAQATTLAEAHALLEQLLPPEMLDTVDLLHAENELIERRHFLSGTGLEPGLELYGPFTGWPGPFGYDGALLKAAELPENVRVWGEPEPRESPIVRHLRELGFTDTYDIQAVILDTFWCKRHGKEFRIKERVDHYRSYRAEIKIPDETAVDPDDRSAVKWVRTYQGEGRPNRRIHLGRSTGSGRLLAYELPIGVYVPGKALMDELQQREANDGMRIIHGQSFDPLPELDGGHTIPYHEQRTMNYRVKTPPPEKKGE